MSEKIVTNHCLGSSDRDTVLIGRLGRSLMIPYGCSRMMIENLHSILPFWLVLDFRCRRLLYGMIRDTVTRALLRLYEYKLIPSGREEWTLCYASPQTPGYFLAVCSEFLAYPRILSARELLSIEI